MRIDDRVRTRMTALIERGKFLATARAQWSGPEGTKLLHESRGWVASALNILQVVFPDPFNAHRAQAMAVAVGPERVGCLAGILQAAIQDIDAGVITTVADSARGEVFDDFLDHAVQFLGAGKINWAAVVVGVAFEDATRRACEKHQIPQKGADLEQLIIALTKADLLTDLKAKRARVAAGLRTKATHAQWDELDRADVDDAIRFTREMIDTILTA